MLRAKFGEKRPVTGPAKHKRGLYVSFARAGILYLEASREGNH